ncbi:MAG TPA: hypothetical protein VG013_02735 [Gemmataceae bacterium]|jgi:hypothetical protein|nr:hypothetical protein [Gemmataceae bacterium]
MSLEDLRDIVRKHPFRPFRLFVSDGAAYEVRHPDLIMLGKRSVAIGLTHDPMATAYDRLAQIDLLHVTRVEPLEAPAPTGDGAAGA